MLSLMPLKIPHVIPVGGAESVHTASQHCWCHPLVEKEGDGFLVTHNAEDLREVRERNGTNRPNETWVNVMELLP